MQWKDTHNELKGRYWLIIAVIAVIFVALFVFWGNNRIQRQSCDKRAEAMGRNWQYGWDTGCLIQTDSGNYVPIENYQQVDINGL